MSTFPLSYYRNIRSTLSSRNVCRITSAQCILVGRYCQRIVICPGDLPSRLPEPSTYVGFAALSRLSRFGYFSQEGLYFLFDENNGLGGLGVNAENAEDGAYCAWFVYRAQNRSKFLFIILSHSSLYDPSPVLLSLTRTCAWEKDV